MRAYPEKTSKLARWSQRLAVFGAATCLVGVALGRFAVFPLLQSLAVFGAGQALCALALVLALAAYAEIWRNGARGLPKANLGLLVALSALAFPGYLVVQAYSLPRINDISTDLRDPPVFSRARSAVEARGGHVPPDEPPQTREAQRLAYRDVAPVILDVSPEEAYKLALEAAQQLKWQIVDRSPPSVRVRTGRLDAIDRSLILRFPDDITIRIRGLGNDTRVDVRSVSRVGRHDFGVNAARIRRYTDLLLQLSKGI
ncbi:MAG TPA: DUF1499 domain-containing protein [Beijerinckiaceae bacterium]|nr:DUF1499 domain-containing protein [Beijerinckiaceae bacterium]